MTSKTEDECGVLVDYLISIIFDRIPRFLPIPRVSAEERRNIAHKLASIIDDAAERKIAN